MRRPNRQWRDDRLGSKVRSGLRPMRSAEPSGAVWERISAELSGRGEPRRRRASFHRATLLSLVVLVAVGFAGAGSQLASDTLSTAPGLEQDGPSPVELDLLSHAAESSDLIMPPEPRPVPQGPPKEAFNRGAWLRAARNFGGTVTPLAPLFRQ